LRIRKTPLQQIDAAVEEAASILGLKDLLSRKPKELSGGQRQRVALGRAIVRKPAVFLFDEPLSNLDAELRVQMRAELSKLQDRLNTTTVYVTHDQVEAMTLGDRIVVLKAGKLMQVGKPLDLYDMPENLFVARFIGSPPMNMLNVTVSDDGLTLQHTDYSIPVPEQLKTAISPYRGKLVAMGVRSEHIGEAGQQNWSTPVEFDGVIEIFEPLGHEIIVHVRCGKERILAKFEATRLPVMGQTIRLTLNADKIHLFDVQTEQRISNVQGHI